MVCLLLFGLLRSGDPASAEVPNLRLCPVHPANPRFCQPFKRTASFLENRCASSVRSHKVWYGCLFGKWKRWRSHYFFKATLRKGFGTVADEVERRVRRV
jgi:hypothetical protein